MTKPNHSPIPEGYEVTTKWREGAKYWSEVFNCWRKSECGNSSFGDLLYIAPIRKEENKMEPPPYMISRNLDLKLQLETVESIRKELMDKIAKEEEEKNTIKAGEHYVYLASNGKYEISTSSYNTRVSLSAHKISLSDQKTIAEIIARTVGEK